MKTIEDSCRITFNIPSSLLLQAIPLAGDLGIEIEKLFAQALADFVARKISASKEIAKNTPPCRPGVMKERGKDIQAGEDTALSISGLSKYFSWGRTAIHQDIRRGYVLEFGTSSTPRHYRSWLQLNPRPHRSPRQSAEVFLAQLK